MHRHSGKFFLGGEGAEPSVPEKYFDNVKKTAHLTHTQ